MVGVPGVSTTRAAGEPSMGADAGDGMWTASVFTQDGQICLSIKGLHRQAIAYRLWIIDDLIID